MGVLSIRPEELRSRANELEQLRQQQLDIMKRLRILVMSLSDSWKGEAQETFVQKFLSKNQEMNDLSTVLEQYISLAREAAQRAENVDNTLLAAVYKLLG